MSASTTPSSHPTRPPEAATNHSTAPPRTLARRPLTAEAVPRRTGQPPSSPLDLRDAFLLLHADGACTLLSIAEMTSRALEDVLRAFERLADDGLIDTPPTPTEDELATVAPPAP